MEHLKKFQNDDDGFDRIGNLRQNIGPSDNNPQHPKISHSSTSPILSSLRSPEAEIHLVYSGTK